MVANPILAKNFRKSWVENIHRGAFCLIESNGKVIFSAGDIKTPIFPHSAIKAMQALAMFKSGAVEKFSLTDKEIALACASHNGEQVHVDGVRLFLEKIDCSVNDLECGCHAPIGRQARKDFFTSKDLLSPIYNACSGKHAGMLAVSRALGEPIAGYSEPNHKVQKMVRFCIEQVIDQGLFEDKCATDGCSIPTFAAPLSAFAFGFARMSSGFGLSDETANASERVFEAAIGNPKLIRGEKTLDSDLMAAFNRRLMIKNGAEAVYCGALRFSNPEKNIGFALKIDDGNLAVSEVVIANILMALGNPNEKEKKTLEQYISKDIYNWRKILVGFIKASDIKKLTGAV